MPPDDSRNVPVSAAKAANAEARDNVNRDFDRTLDQWTRVGSDTERYLELSESLGRSADWVWVVEAVRRDAVVALERFREATERLREVTTIIEAVYIEGDAPRIALEAHEGAYIAAKALTPRDREKFAREIASRLGERSWLCEGFVTEPFLLEVELSPMLSPDVIAEYYETMDRVRFDLAPFLQEGIDPARLVFLALYPSGAVRGLTTAVEGNGTTWVSLRDASALLDPDGDSARPPSRCEVRLVALEAPVS